MGYFVYSISYVSRVEVAPSRIAARILQNSAQMGCCWHVPNVFCIHFWLTEVLPPLSSGAGSREPGAGSREPGAGSREPGAGSREPGAGSREPGAGGVSPEAGCGFRPHRRVNPSGVRLAGCGAAAGNIFSDRERLFLAPITAARRMPCRPRAVDGCRAGEVGSPSPSGDPASFFRGFGMNGGRLVAASASRMCGGRVAISCLPGNRFRAGPQVRRPCLQGGRRGPPVRRGLPHFRASSRRRSASPGFRQPRKAGKSGTVGGHRPWVVRQRAKSVSVAGSVGG
jgi:hypothetical protein